MSSYFTQLLYPDTSSRYFIQLLYPVTLSTPASACAGSKPGTRDPPPACASRPSTGHARPAAPACGRTWGAWGGDTGTRRGSRGTASKNTRHVGETVHRCDFFGAVPTVAAHGTTHRSRGGRRRQDAVEDSPGIVTKKATLRHRPGGGERSIQRNRYRRGDQPGRQYHTRRTKGRFTSVTRLTSFAPFNTIWVICVTYTIRTIYKPLALSLAFPLWQHLSRPVQPPPFHPRRAAFISSPSPSLRVNVPPNQPLTKDRDAIKRQLFATV